MSGTRRIPFIKMQGIGNDFVVIDDLTGYSRGGASITSEFARFACDRRFGIGADQLVWIKAPLDPSLYARVEFLNADGSSAEMCGNALRAVAVYLRSLKEPYATREARSEFRLETVSGVKTVKVQGSEVAVDMGPPALGGGFPAVGEGLLVKGREVRFFEVNMGNPHAVIFVESWETYPAGEYGPLIETHSRFPKRTNVEFVKVDHDATQSPKGADASRANYARGAIDVKVWERGAGLTLACGSGACGAAVAALATGRVASPVEVRLPGGNLLIEWGGSGQSVIMTGPAAEVFRGEIAWPIPQ